MQVAVDLPLLGGSGSEDEMRFSRRVDDRETVVDRLGGIKAQRERHAVEQRLQGDAQLKLGKRCPETMVLAPAEREMTIGRSAQQEALRLGEPRRVAVGRAHPGGDELPLLDRATAKLHRLFHGSPSASSRAVAISGRSARSWWRQSNWTNASSALPSPAAAVSEPAESSIAM